MLLYLSVVFSPRRSQENDSTIAIFGNTIFKGNHIAWWSAAKL